MPIEVEQKYRIAHRTALHSRLKTLCGIERETVTQVDTYYAHPARDFAETDEALRIRRVGDENFITYKGPKLQAETKTRREIELPLMAGQLSHEQWSELLGALSFSRVAEVTKHRQIFLLSRDGHTIEVCLDQVKDLGDFAELEIVVQQENEIAPAQALLQSLASELQLAGAERRSYLELLLGF